MIETHFLLDESNNCPALSLTNWINNSCFKNLADVTLSNSKVGEEVSVMFNLLVKGSFCKSCNVFLNSLINKLLSHPKWYFPSFFIFLSRPAKNFFSFFPFPPQVFFSSTIIYSLLQILSALSFSLFLNVHKRDIFHVHICSKKNC